jgi:hypothetical protein
MARYVAPDRGVRETVIGEKTYRPDKGGIYTVESASHARAMKAEGFLRHHLILMIRKTASAVIPA